MKKNFFILASVCLGVVVAGAYASGTDNTTEQNACVRDASANALPDDYKLLLELARRTQQPVKDFETRLDIADSPAIGSRTAAAVLVEFGDFQCRYCRR